MYIYLSGGPNDSLMNIQYTSLESQGDSLMYIYFSGESMILTNVHILLRKVEGTP